MAADLRDHEQKKKRYFVNPRTTLQAMQFVFTFAVNMSPEYPADHHCQISELWTKD